MLEETVVEGLPIENFKEEIVDSVAQNSVTIVVADTGAGKSTQVPQYLLDAGYNVVVTQPRRLAARSVATRVASERETELGQEIGFRTAFEHQDSALTRCLFCTDGLALVRELVGIPVKNRVLVIDEVHEWNLNIEVLVAWTKLKVSEGANFKVVIMSATLEAERLSQFFNQAPVIDVPGRLFPVEEIDLDNDEIGTVVAWLKQRRNVLWFKPGKSEIAKAIQDLEAIPDLTAQILPLHGELSTEEQDQVFRHYGRPKCVVSTNVAQTSVTIDDIDAVADSGMERRIELVGGVEGLYLKPISLADARQRKGRAGRTKTGLYANFCPETERPEFPTAEILRTRLDQTVLRLAEAGFNAEELEFFHQPDRVRIHEAHEALVALGCMDKLGRVTAIGHRVAKMPISVKFARMVIEAERLGVVDDVIDIAAILEQGGVTARKIRRGRGQDAISVDAEGIWKHRFCPNERESDILAQLAVFQQAEEMSNDERYENGVFIKAYHQARQVRRHLAEALRGKVQSFHSNGNRDNILKAVCAGMVDHVFQRRWAGMYVNGGTKERKLANESVLRYNQPAWLVGLPFDLEIENKRWGGKMTINLIQFATKVEPEWLAEVAPQLVKVEKGKFPHWSYSEEEVVSETITTFNGVVIEKEIVSDPDHPEAAGIIRIVAEEEAGWTNSPYRTATTSIVEDMLAVERARAAEEAVKRQAEEEAKKETPASQSDIANLANFFKDR